MTPDHDTSLTKALVRLHERTRADAPLFSVMRDRALHETREGTARPATTPNCLRCAAFTTAASVAVAILAWWPRQGQLDVLAFSESASLQKAESLLSSIEHQIAANEAVFDPIYPTDFLIATVNEPTTP